MILFSSQARGAQVEGWKSSYFSDYGLLVVVNNEKSAEPEYWYKTEDRFAEERITRRIKAPIGLIVHDYGDINIQLTVGRPFFVDVIRDGVTLYKVEHYPFVKPKAI